MSINYPIQVDENGQYIIIRRNETLDEIDRIYEIWNAEVSERVNGEYTFSFETVPTDRIMALIQPPNIIEVDNDYFRIRRIKKSRSNSTRMQIDCEHISYRINDEPKFKGKSYYGTPQAIIEEILSNAPPFKFSYSDFRVQVEFDSETAGKRSRIIELAKYLGGEAQFHKFNVSIITRRGHDHGIHLEVGKNVLSLTETTEFNNTEDRSSSSYEVEAIDLNFVIDDSTNEPLEAEDIHLGDTLRLIDHDLGIDKKDRVVAISYDPFKHLLPTIEFANQVEDLYNTDVATSTDNRSAQAYFWNENESNVTVTSADTQVLVQDIVGLRDTYYDISATVNFVTTGATLVTLKIQTAGTVYGTYQQQINHAGSYVLDVDRFINNVEMGGNVTHLIMSSSSGSITIAKGKATMLIRTSGVLGGASQERPDRQMTENFTPPVLNMSFGENVNVSLQNPLVYPLNEYLDNTIQNVDIYESHRVQIIPISEFTTSDRALFANMSKYSSYDAPSQTLVDEFIDVINVSENLFRLVTIGDYLCIISTSGTSIYLDQTTNSVNSDGIMVLCDHNGNNTAIGYEYIFPQQGNIHNRETLLK